MRVLLLFAAGALAAAEPVVVGQFLMQESAHYPFPAGIVAEQGAEVVFTAQNEPAVVLKSGALVLRNSSFEQQRLTKPAMIPPPDAGAARQIARSADGRIAVAAANGLYHHTGSGPWRRLFPRQSEKGWALEDVRGVAFTPQGALWFAAPQGVGRLKDHRWELYTVHEGLPYDDFTCVAAAPDDSVWLGTTKGAIRFDGRHWEYRQGRRWLLDDHVLHVAVDAQGAAWIATPGGLTQIRNRRIRLAEKAAHFEAEIDHRHKRTEYGYVHPVLLDRPGDLTSWKHTDSDNDGLWTSMYGAAQCFAYAVTRSEESRRRAQAAFRALRFLGEVTQGGSHPAPPGFVARTVVPAESGDPNVAYTPERDRVRRQTRDRLWKVIVPRWPKSADGKWYWKSDTSSDELDGHFFFYALYYDLVAQTPAERREVQQHVRALAGHLVDHGFRLVDHDGKPTRWGIFDPENLNHNRDWWQERGINSLSILAYLKVAEHITGEPRFAAAAAHLVRNHGYGMNVLIPKTHLGPGAGNQSDDEMIFMNFFHLIRYEKDADLRQKYLLAFHHAWQNEFPEMNPLFHFLYAAVGRGATYEAAFGKLDLSPRGEWLEDSLDTLRRFPLDRVDWALAHGHRKDIVRLPDHYREGGTATKGMRRHGKVLPVDERHVVHWNHDPWELNQGGSGKVLADGAAFLLPYYLGRYYQFFAE